MSTDQKDIERFEDLLLDWMRTVLIFFIAGIALYHFTDLGKSYTIISFGLSLVLVITMIVDYLLRRNELTSRGIDIRLPLDIMIVIMIIAAVLITWISWEVIVEPYYSSNVPYKDITNEINIDMFD